MGKGDKKSRRGKIFLGTYGVRRRRKKSDKQVLMQPEINKDKGLKGRRPFKVRKVESKPADIAEVKGINLITADVMEGDSVQVTILAAKEIKAEREAREVQVQNEIEGKDATEAVEAESKEETTEVEVKKVKETKSSKKDKESKETKAASKVKKADEGDKPLKADKASKAEKREKPDNEGKEVKKPAGGKKAEKTEKADKEDKEAKPATVKKETKKSTTRSKEK